MTNVPLIERIKARCLVCGDCWIWQGHAVRGKSPQMKVDGVPRSVRRLLYVEKHGPLPDSVQVAATCETRNCVSHAEPQSHSTIGKRVAATGVMANPVRCAKIAASKQKTSSPLTRAQAMDIRYGGGTLKEAAARHGVSRSTAAVIRRGERWKEYGSVFAGLGARA